MADIRQVMQRMVQLMETLLPSLPQPPVVCPTHCSPAHHAYLSHSSPTHSFPSPSFSQMTSLAMDTPISLPSSPVIVPQQHRAVCHRDPRRPQDPQAGCPGLPSSRLPSHSFALHFQPILTETHFPFSPSRSPLTSQRKDGAPCPAPSRQHSPLLPDQGGVNRPQSSGRSTQTELGGT